MLNKLLFVVLLCAGCSASHQQTGSDKATGDHESKPVAATVSPQSYLRKLSMHLRGETPSRAEYKQLDQAISDNKADNFFKGKIDEYLSSSQHIDKMTSRLEELFFVKPSPVPFYSPLVSQVEDYPIHNSLNQLFRDMAARNLNWDTLLIGHDYTVFPALASSRNELSDGEFLSFIGTVPPKPASPTSVAFDQDDARISGSITTSRFFNRYANTALNKNRRRAAAIFRIFMCDDMKAVVVDEKGKQGEILDRVFPTNPGGGNGPTAGNSDDVHGTDPQCMKCHYKLDPMGQTFQASGVALAPLASPGALVFTSVDGHKTNQPVGGIGELGQAIIHQDEYTRCQVQHFWNWFVGQDIEIKNMAELTAKFDEVGHRTNDFIRYLVTRPEFGGADTRNPTEVLIANVKGVLNNCNDCHAAHNVPSFTAWPIGGSIQKHAFYLKKIRADLSLDDASVPRKMPPPDGKSRWYPTPTDMAVIKKWFAEGNPTDARH